MHHLILNNLLHSIPKKLIAFNSHALAGTREFGNLLFIFFLLIALVLLNSDVVAQSTANYTPTRTTGITYNSIAASGTSFTSWRNSTNLDDNRSGFTPIGFKFYYLGTPYTSFNISTNGFIDLSSSTAAGGGTGAYGYANTQFSATGGTLLSLAPLYDDLTAPTVGGSLAGNFKYLNTGSAPNRILTVEWIDMDLYGNATPSLNYQIKLYEATGIIQFVYGTMTSGTATYTYTCGINASTMSATPTTAQLLTQRTANTATFSSTPQNSLATVPASNTMITFTPPAETPAAPITMTFSVVTQTSLTVNWRDNSINETFFIVNRATAPDGPYTQVGTVTSTTMASLGTLYSFANTSLTPSTIYYFQISAANEGTPPSSDLTGNQTTLAAGNIISNGTGGGNWNTTTTWVGGVVPTNVHNATIVGGDIVTIDANASCANLNVNGTLYIGNNNQARTVTVNGDINVTNTGTLQVLTTSNTTHTLNCGGNITNNGTVNLNPDANSSCNTIFNRLGNQTVSGSGETTRFNLITLNMGTSKNNVLDISSSSFLVPTPFLTLTNGTFKLSTNVTIVPFAADPNIPSTAGMWVNGGTVNSGNFNWTFSGTIRVSNGILNVGNTADNQTLSNAGEIIIEGGSLNIAGRFSRATGSMVDFTMSGGSLTVPTVSSTSTTIPPFTIDNISSSFTMSGGTIIIRRAGDPGGANLGYQNIAGAHSITGGTIQIGDALTPVDQTMSINTLVPIYNLSVNGTNSPTAILQSNLLIVNNLLSISAGGILNANNLNITLNGDWSNSGNFLAGTGTVVMNSLSPQSISGSSITSFNNLTIANTSTTTLTTSSTNVNGLFLLNGSLAISANTLVLNGATSGTGTLTCGPTGTVNYAQSSNGQSVLIANYGNLIFSNFNKLLQTGTIRIAGVFTPGSAIAHSTTGNTIEFNGGVQTVPSFNGTTGYNNIIASGSGLKSILSSITASGNFTIDPGASVSINNGVTVQVNGDVVNAGSLTNNSNINTGN